MVIGHFFNNFSRSVDFYMRNMQKTNRYSLLDFYLLEKAPISRGSRLTAETKKLEYWGRRQSPSFSSLSIFQTENRELRSGSSCGIGVFPFYFGCASWSHLSRREDRIQAVLRADVWFRERALDIFPELKGCFIELLEVYFGWPSRTKARAVVEDFCTTDSAERQTPEMEIRCLVLESMGECGREPADC